MRKKIQFELFIHKKRMKEKFNETAFYDEEFLNNPAFLSCRLTFCFSFFTRELRCNRGSRRESRLLVVVLLVVVVVVGMSWDTTQICHVNELAVPGIEPGSENLKAGVLPLRQPPSLI